MKVVFRVDASTRIGTGHLMRCLALARALRARGVQPKFICREHAGNLISLLQQEDIPVAVLPAPAKGEEAYTEDYAAWLGVPLSVDAEQTLEVLNDEKPDWLVVDHYGLDIDWERRLHSHVDKLMVIDDLANRHHDSDILLDQNYSAENECRYRGLLPDTCKLLVGPRYALLHSDYEMYRQTLRIRDGRVRRILVFFGSIDPHNITGLALEALSTSEFAHMEVYVVVGINNPYRAVLEEQVAARPLTKVYSSRAHLADLMVQADLAIGAGGVTTWERMCLGLPTIMVSIADNQKPTAESLNAAKLVQYVGHSSNLGLEELIQALRKLVDSPNQLVDLGIQSQLQVDSFGAARVAEVLYPTCVERIFLRPARKEDIILYFNWVNDPEVRRQAIHSAPISWSQHQSWFAKKMASARSHLFVLQAGLLPVGQIRFDCDVHEALIDYSLDMFVRGRGWGSRMISMGALYMWQRESIILKAMVKTRNYASCAVFKRLGFEETQFINAEEGVRVFLLRPCQREA